VPWRIRRKLLKDSQSYLIGTSAPASIAFKSVVGPRLQGEPVLGDSDRGSLLGLGRGASNIPRVKTSLCHVAKDVICHEKQINIKIIMLE